RHTRFSRDWSSDVCSSDLERIRELTNDIIDRVSEKGSCDFVVDIAAELPLQVIAEVMGVPLEDRHKVFDWSNRMIGAEDPEYARSEERRVGKGCRTRGERK